MPIAAKQDDTRRLVVARASGPLLTTDVMAFISDRRTGSGRHDRLLFDLRDVTTMPSGDELRSLAELLATLSRTLGRGRAALVASTTTVYASARILELLCHELGVNTVRACHDLADAEAWLA